ncbi:hypothetical protein E2320_002587 [Naja naja]|nr:hypothetical protein E2320_002587 [Naja naja]
MGDWIPNSLSWHTSSWTSDSSELLEDVATDPVYVNLQELQLEHSTTTANDSQSPFQLCLSNPLNNWEIHTDTESGHFFYYNSVTGQTTWESPFGASLNSMNVSHSHCPNPVSSEWNQYVDEASGQIFFYNAVTGETSWEAPEETFNPTEMQPAFTRRSLDRRPPTPETDYQKLSPHEHEFSPEEDYSPDGSYKQFDYAGIPSSDQGCASPGNPETSMFELKSLEKAGMLYRTRTADKGKRLRKNWACVWTVLEGGALIFFKDSKHSASSGTKYPSVLSSPEFKVNLHGAYLSWAHKDRSSRKNVLELKTRDGSEYLIQHDLDSIASMWHDAISNRISRLSIDFPLEVDDDNLAAVKSKEQTGGSKEKETEKKHPVFWHSSSSDSDSNKIRNMLRKFLLKRPSLQYLRDRGYIKDQVFGCALQDICDREKSTVPHFVRQCIATVEKRGLDIDGLYRISGNLATIQNLRFKVDHDEYLDLDDGHWDDVHVITGALKLFFRELPEPLFPFSYFNRLIAAAEIIDPAMRRHHLREVVYSLPRANFNTSRVLFQHLSRVVEFREKNRMSLQSIAIVFGPTLLRPQDEEGNIAMYMFFQNQVMEQILSQTSYIFPES